MDYMRSHHANMHLCEHVGVSKHLMQYKPISVHYTLSSLLFCSVMDLETSGP